MLPSRAVELAGLGITEAGAEVARLRCSLWDFTDGSPALTDQRSRLPSKTAKNYFVNQKISRSLSLYDGGSMDMCLGFK